MTRRSLIVSMLAVLLLAPPAAHAATAFKCAMGTINDVQHEWCKRFIARIEKASNGLIAGQVFPAGQLGTTTQLIQGVQLGTIENLFGRHSLVEALGHDPVCRVHHLPKQ